MQSNTEGDNMSRGGPDSHFGMGGKVASTQNIHCSGGEKSGTFRQSGLNFKPFSKSKVTKI